MAIAAVGRVASSGRHDRRKTVEAALAGFARSRSARRVAPPDGRLGPDDYPIHGLRLTLASLGPVFASVGRYFAARPDLLPRRECGELALIADTAPAADPAALDACVERQLGAPPVRRFFQFDSRARDVTLWTERHDAWLTPGVPVVVTVVRPDAADWIESDLPLLSMVRTCLGIAPTAFEAAIVDFAHTLRARLDQTLQAASLAALAADAPSVGGFGAPACYRDHCAPGILTVERVEGPTVSDFVARRAEEADLAVLANRVASAWLRHALAGHVIPFDFDAGDVIVAEDRLVLTRAAFEAHSAAERARFSRYMNAVAADDPDAAASWIVDAAGASEPSSAIEEELRRRFRQAVPFRDGEWSGDDRMAEYLLVQWRAASETGWRLTPHHLHVYRGVGAVAGLAHALAPDEDALLSAFQDVRLRLGMSEAAQLLDPGAMTARLDSALREMVTLPQKLDEVLTLAAEGRLRVKLQVPESADARRVKQQTTLLVANLVVLTAIASLVRHVAPAYGPGLERAGVVALLIVGGWLLVAAARL
jgi:predicted unusual protein kinase regulating ubiquinone biosynthesis (AarF/ABC1/UbiB family)